MDVLLNEHRKLSPVTITVSLYHIHYYFGMLNRSYHIYPDKRLNTTLTMAESEEAEKRFVFIFRNFAHFDGYSTTNPKATVPRYYSTAFNTSEFLPRRPFESLIKGAAFVASNCQRKGTSDRDRLTKFMWDVYKYRVDSLGKCHKTKHVYPDTVYINDSISHITAIPKRLAISHYLFYLAFENIFEPGYVTEKVFDALCAGLLLLLLLLLL